MSLTIPTAPLIGHAPIEQRLLGEWQRGTLPHSLLFTGPQGIGKASTALRLAAFALCGGAGDGLFGPSDLSVDPGHPAAGRIEAGSHGDFKRILPDTSTATAAIKVDAVRELAGFLSLTPSEAQWRVVLIDSADDLNLNAANALLKVLEEPPDYCLMILISHAPGRLLPTIRSRCRTVPFKPIDRGGFDAVMQAHLPSTQAPALAALHALSSGSPGVAITLDQHDAIALYEQLLHVYAHYPVVDEEALGHLAHRVAGAKDKAVWRTWRLLWDQFLYRLQLWQAGVSLSPIHAEEEAVMTRLAGEDPARWHRWQDDAARLFHDTEILHLDRTQAIHSVLMQTV